MTVPTSEQSVLSALGAVVDPVFDKPMVELGTLSAIEIAGGRVTMTAKLCSPMEGLRSEAERRIRAALTGLNVEPMTSFEIDVPTREVRGDDPIPDVRNVLLVMSGKGGVGKSTVATNLAMALARGGARVGLLDADIYGPSIPTMLGISGQPHSEDGKTIRPLSRFGIKLMSIGFLLEDPHTPVVWRGPMLHSALKQFVGDVLWEELDYLVVDLPPGTGDVALSLAQNLKVTGAVMVTTPQEVALQDVYKGVKMCEKLNIPILGVVENMSFFIDTAGVRHELFGSGGGQKVADYAKSPLLGQIPIDTEVRRWGDDGTPVVQAAPGTAAAKAFVAVAESVAIHVARHHFEAQGSKTAPTAKATKHLRILR